MDRRRSAIRTAPRDARTRPTDTTTRWPIAVQIAVAVAATTCQPSAGYMAPSLNSPHQGIPPPNSVQAAGSGTPQLSPAGAPIPEQPTTNDRANALGCGLDSDCVPASCCHPTSCVPRGRAPVCANIHCTSECRGGTLDCGGVCACEGGLCVTRTGNSRAAAVLRRYPDSAVLP
jgi:hypothetical protein